MASSEAPDPQKPLFIHISPHGLIRGRNPELGRDLDTGGQVTYVLELTRALANHGDCILLTRLIDDETCNPPLTDEYSQPEEIICPGTKIVRLRCGPRRYVRKELLWDVLHSFVDNALEYILSLNRRPSIIHGHYADGAFVAQMLSDMLAIPMAFTGHSLGRTKLKNLLRSKKKNFKQLNHEFKLRRRIDAEERALMSSSVIIANSQTEINSQWRAMYDGFHALENVFSAHALRPGVGIERFVLEDGQEHPQIWKDIDRRLTDATKPVILVLARLAREKNIATMIEAFGESQELQERCNLVIVCGQRTDPFHLSPQQRELLTQILLLIEKYDLEGKISRPRSHKRADVSAIFALPAHRGGVFVNIALREPFGLTLIEAAVNGTPIIATNHDAGPEIVQGLRNGIVVDPLDKKEIEQAILQLVSEENADTWREFHENSLANSQIYSWEGHVHRYIGMVESVQTTVGRSVLDHQEELSFEDDTVLIITDIDNTLLGPTREAKEGFAQLVSIVRANPKFKLSLATGRSIESAVSYIHEHDPKLIEECLFIISSVGSEIHSLSSEARQLLAEGHTLNLRPELVSKYMVKDELYDEHVSFRFDKDAIKEFIEAEWPELIKQGYETGHAPSEQRNFKVSYVIREDKITRQHRSELSEDDQTSPMFDFFQSFTGSSGSPVGGSPGSSLMGSGSRSRPPDSFDDYSGGSCSPPVEFNSEPDEAVSPRWMTSTLAGDSDDDQEMVDESKIELTWADVAPMVREHNCSSQSLYSWGNDSVASTGSLSLPTSGSSTPRLSRSRSGTEQSNLNRYLHRKVPELLKSELRSKGLVCDVIDSHGKYVDILPIRATKGKAIRYLMARHNIRFDRVVTCGDSGNDLDMLQGNTKAIVVANRDKELKSFLNSQHNHNCVHYATRKYAHGIIEGLLHYGFLSAEDAIFDNDDEISS